MKRKGFLISFSILQNSALSKEIGDYKHAEDYWVGKKFIGLFRKGNQRTDTVRYIRKNLKPGDMKVFIYHGDADMSVPITQSERIASVYREVLGERECGVRKMKGIRTWGRRDV